MFGQIGQGGLRFELLGFPVRIDPSFWIISVLMGLSYHSLGVEYVAMWVGVVFVSILAHELGHAMMGRQFGLHSKIELYSMGGLTHLSGGRSLRHWQDIAVSLAGPGTGLLIGGIIWAALWTHGEPTSMHAGVALRMLLWVSVVWALANLLPIEPWDGGHVMASAVHWIRRYEDPALPHMISAIFGLAAALLAWKLDFIWGALLAGLSAAKNIMQLREYGPVHPKDMQVALGVLLFVAAGVFALLRYLGLLEGGLLG